jgi:DNA repair exonuclease SbcCD nuclease subunit
VDKGKSIDIHDWRNRDSTLAALQLSAQKWGSFTVTGNDEYKAMCAKLAAEHGFKITNPELQERIQQERQRIQQERAQAMKSEQLKQFELYAEAVGAERYRVTSIKMQARTEGSKPSSSTRRTASRGASRRRRSSSARRRCCAYSAGAKTSTTRRYRTRSITSSSTT